MLKAIRHGLANLLDVDGRDARQAFWYFVLFLYLVTVLLNLAVSGPLMMQGIATGLHQGMVEAGGQSPRMAGNMARTAMMHSVGNYMPLLFLAAFASGMIMLLGLAAALVRRLHDSGLSGFWAAIPGVLQAIYLATIPYEFDQIGRMMSGPLGGSPHPGLGIFDGPVGVGTAASWGAILALIVLGIRKSTDGPNRFGEAPFTA